MLHEILRDVSKHVLRHCAWQAIKQENLMSWEKSRVGWDNSH